MTAQALSSKQEQKAVRRHLLDLGGGWSEAEADELSPLHFCPVAEHVRALDPDVVLVVGERGAGKSTLFRAVFGCGLLSALARHVPHPRLPSGDPERTVWIQAYPLSHFPDGAGLRRCLDGGGPEMASKLWFAYLIRALRDPLEDHCAASVRKAWEPPGGRPTEVLEAFDAAGDEPLIALDELDERLAAQDRWIFAGYDELATLGGYDWVAMHQALLGVVGLWAGNSRRWRRLRAKLFLRTDLFRRQANFGGADLAKLSANRAELMWNDRNLFAMLIKRIANTHEDLLSYCRQSKLAFKPRDPELGYVPELESEQGARPFIERLLGQYMGAAEKKGRAFSWVLDHLRDARGHVAPRNLVRLIEHAAGNDKANQKAEPPRLLHPVALRQALEDVSADHVRQGISHEWPWLHGLRRIIQGKLMPMERGELRDLLNAAWEGSWGSAPAILPPVDDATELIDYLLELGVLRERPNQRVDVPDVYLFGLGLKRKGGVRNS